jgi:hypothetical protein
MNCASGHLAPRLVRLLEIQIICIVLLDLQPLTLWDYWQFKIYIFLLNVKFRIIGPSLMSRYWNLYTQKIYYPPIYSSVNLPVHRHHMVPYNPPFVFYSLLHQTFFWQNFDSWIQRSFFGIFFVIFKLFVLLNLNDFGI